MKRLFRRKSETERAHSKSQHRQKKRSRKKGRGALLTVMMLFLLSALARLSGETGQAIAREISEMTEETSGEGHMPQSCIPPEDGIADLLHDLDLRQVRLEARERHIEDRMQALNVAQVAYEANIERLIAAENALQATMSRSSTAAEDDLTRLTSVYENMKPKDAAALFETMDNEFAAGFLGRMRPDAAAAVFAGLEPETAYRISIVLAGRNANAPRE